MSIDKRVRVALDTNMLMLMAEGIAVLDHLREELETEPLFIVITPVIKELEEIADSGKGKLRRQALFAIELARRLCTIVEYPLRDRESVDDALVRYALENNAIIATNDKELRSRLRSLGLPNAYLREESMRVKVNGFFK